MKNKPKFPMIKKNNLKEKDKLILIYLIDCYFKFFLLFVLFCFVLHQIFHKLLIFKQFIYQKRKLAQIKNRQTDKKNKNKKIATKICIMNNNSNINLLYY